MKKQAKKNLIAALSLAFVASLGVAGLAKTDVYATGEVEEVAVEGNFQMVDGAAIRIKSNTPSGIRWSVTVSESYYNYVTSLGEVEWGMVVDNKPITEKGGATQEVIPLKNQTLPKFTANDGKEETWTYYASITYDELDVSDTATLTKVYETVLYARAYNVVNDVTTMAIDADTGRSIKGVAMNCLVQENTTGNDDVTTDNKSTFVEYAGGEYATIESETVTKNAYDTKNATGTVISQDTLAAGTYSVYVGAKKFDDVTLGADGAISTTVSGLGSTLSTVGETNNVRFINADGEVYQVPFVSATHLISTADELKNYINSYDASVDTTGWYAVLTDNITISNQWDTGKGGNVYFRGTFDGLGHMVTGPIYSWNAFGLFGGVVGTAGTIKNVGFDGLYSPAGGAYALSGYMAGTMENVYVKATTAAASQYVKVQYNGTTKKNGVMKNCVFDVTYTGTQGAATAEGSAGNRTNVFTIGNTTDTLCTGNYATTAAFLAAQGENACWSGHWTFNDFGLCFGDTLVAQYATETKATAYGAAYTYANNAYTKQDTFTVDVSSLIGNAENYTVLLDGEEVETDGVLTLNVANYTMGSTHEVTVAANGKVYSQPFMVVSHAIGTEAELKTYIDNNGSTDETAIAEEKTWYAVLTDDITFTTRWDAGKANSVAFRGTFDGLGHMITGPIYAWNSGGLFGAIQAGAIVKNVGFDGLYSANAPANALSGFLSGTMENVYVKASTANTAQYVRFWGGTVKNCVFDVNFTGSTAGKTIWNKWGSFSNIFSIGSVDASINSDGSANDITTNYATVADFISEQLANVNTTNGWNMDVWSVKEGKLYFGTALVG